MIHGVEELLAHAHQRRGAAGREIEPAEQFQPARLAAQMQLGGGSRRTASPARPRSAASMRAWSGPKVLRQRLEEGDARPGGEVDVFGENFAASATPEASPRPDSSSSQSSTRPSERPRAVARSRTIKRAAALGDALQHLAEERRCSPNRPHSLVASRANDSGRDDKFGNAVKAAQV